MKKNLFITFIILSFGCSGQKKPDVTLIYDSKVYNYAAISITKNDSAFFATKYYWMVYKNLSLWGSHLNGIKYKYNYDDSTLSTLNGIFETNKRVSTKSDFTGNIEFNFYFDDGIVGWFT